ncbi:hypothetical protein SEUCBS140593_002495 [Sporothrix eucalyptigena]|uniref:Zinc finger Mcm10/DnaG-type domain-containing protein n=1 Tax=Sporothrix eucalyptigena TaxID=1812306 RepID=A0ABP0B703_9PEZI
MRNTRAGSHGLDENMDVDEEEDEETLQLQLQEIQAKLRLKKLQAAKAQKAATTDSSARSTPGSARIGGGSSGAATFHNPRSPQRSTIEVPASPVRRAQSVAETATQKSPKRVLLGIDKGLRGQDVSLRRPPSSFLRGLTGGAGRSSVLDKATNGSISSQREQAPRPLSFNERLAAARTEESARQDKSERIQKLRTSGFTVGKDEMDQYKAKAVDIPVVDKGPQKFSREDILGAASGRKPYDDGSGRSTLLRRSNTTPNIRSKYTDESATSVSRDDMAAGAASGGDAAEPDEASFEPYSGFHLTRRILPHSVVARSVSGKTTYAIQDLLRLVKAPHFELPDVETDVVVFGIIAEKSDPRSHKPAGSGAGAGAQQDRGKYMVLTLVDLTYQIELFLFKSGFDRFWKLSTGTVVAILNPGVMPPPPGRHDTGKWSLVINSDDDTILEIGNARDLGYCKSVKRDGHQCSSWINAKRTEFCEYHTNEAAKKMRATRNDLNGAAGFGYQEKGGRGGRGGGRGGANSRGGAGRGGRGGTNTGTGYDRFSQSQWFASGTSSSSLIDSEVLDGGYADKVERKEGIKRRLAAKERETDIARKLGEIGSGAGRDYMKLTGNSQAASKKTSSSSSTASSSSATRSSQHSQLSSTSSATTVLSAAEQAAASRASLLASIAERRSGAASTTGIGNSGLHIRNNTPKLGLTESATAPAVHLGPAKRKRPQSALSIGTAGTGTGSSTANATVADDSRRNGLGWGSDLRAKLGRMKDGERLTNNQTIQNGFKRAAATGTLASSESTPVLPAPERSPVRKKTRFLLGDKGIREAGRESLGATGCSVPINDDEDELVII